MTYPRISFSNLAWLSAEDAAVAKLLASRGVRAVDLTMGRYFEKPYLASSVEWKTVTTWWRERDFAIPALQSLLFGVGQRNIFSGVEDRQYLLAALSRVISLSAENEISRLVFGSPMQRKRLKHDQSEIEIALDFFFSVGEQAASNGVTLLIEPNSVIHGCNFINESAEAIDFVNRAGSKGLGVNLDLGSESLESLNTQNVNLGQFGHLHVSSETLEPLGQESSWVPKLKALPKLAAFDFLTIEQLGSEQTANLPFVEKALDAFEGAINHG